MPELHAPGSTPADIVLPEPVALGAFDIHARIGMGGMGEVWRGLHRDQSLPVAIKVLTSFAIRDEAALTAFRNEVRAVAGFEHPNIITVFDYGEVTVEADRKSLGALEAGSPYLVMELASGGWLDPTLVQLEWVEVQALLTALLDGLAHAHARGVVHRDLKPENVLLPKRGDSWGDLKLTDFGIAHVAEWLDPESTVDPMSGAGTPHYMAPEQIYCRWRDQGPWTDLYAIGCMTWELLSGFPPFDFNDVELVVDAQLSHPLPELKPRIAIPEGLRGWLARLLSKSPRDRFRSAADALWALSRFSPPSLLLAPSDGTDDASHGGRMGQTTQKIPTPRAATVTHLTPRPPSKKSKHGVDEGLSPFLGWFENLPPFPPEWRAPESELKSVSFIGAGLGLFGVRTIPLVARDAERNVLWNTLKNVRASTSARLVVLRGPTGVGKSRLAQWLCQRAEEVGTALSFRTPHSRMTPETSGIRYMLTQHFQCQGMPRAAVRKRLENILVLQGSTDPYDWHALTEILCDPMSEDPDPGGRPVVFSSSSEKFAVIRRYLTRVAHERPIVIWFDDAHHGAESLAFARYLLRFRVGLPVLIVVTMQEEAVTDRKEEFRLLERILRLPGTIDMRVPPLNESSTLALIRRLLMFDGELTHRIAERVAGNPAFAIGLVADWVRRGVLELGHSGFLVRPGFEDDLPDDLYAIWSRKLDRFVSQVGHEDGGHALEVAAALGQRFESWEWHVACLESGLCGARSSDVSELLHRLTNDLLTENLARESGSMDHLIFVHSMVRESLERRSREAGRWEAINLACSRMLDKTQPLGGRSERLGRHFVAAEGYGQAIAPLISGARRLWQKGALAHALELLAIREDALLRAEVGERDARWGEGWVFRARLSSERGNFHTARRWAEAAFTQAERWASADWEPVAAEASLVHATIAFRCGELDVASDRLAEAWQFYKDADASQNRARAMQLEGEVAAAGGDFGRAVDLINDAMASFRLLDSAHDVARCMRSLGELAWVLGETDEAIALFEAGHRLCEEHGDRLTSSLCIQGVAEVQRSRGQFAEAKASLDAAIGQLQDLDADWQPLRARLALVKLHQGEFEAAGQLLGECIAEADARKLRALSARFGAMALVPAAKAMDWRGFDRLLDRVESSGLRHLVHPDVAWTTALAGEFAELAGESSRAAQSFRVSLEQWEGLGRVDRAEHLREWLNRYDGTLEA